MPPKVMVPVSGSWSVAIMRISVDLPAPFGPSRPYMPAEVMGSRPSAPARRWRTSWRRRECVVPCGLLLPLQDEVIAARVEPQLESWTTVRAPAEGQKRAVLAECPILDPWPQGRRGAVEGGRDPLRRLRDLDDHLLPAA